jgi:uncharacterized protein YcbX
MTARVSWISFTPVKGTALQLVDEVEVLDSGLAGDRRFYFIGERGRRINAEDSSLLQLVRAEYDAAADELTLRFTDGRVVSAPVERGDVVDTTFGRRPRTARLVHGPFAEAISELMGEPVRLVEPEESATDRGPIGAATLLSTGSLSALASVLGVDAIDARRFRMNFGVDGVEAHGEDAWCGKRLRIGTAVVIPQGNVGRCVITKQNPETGERDLDTLNGLASYRRDIETTEPLPFGVHATVDQPGRVRIGDAVELV